MPRRCARPTILPKERPRGFVAGGTTRYGVRSIFKVHALPRKHGFAPSLRRQGCSDGGPPELRPSGGRTKAWLRRVGLPPPPRLRDLPSQPAPAPFPARSHLRGQPFPGRPRTTALVVRPSSRPTAPHLPDLLRHLSRHFLVYLPWSAWGYHAARDLSWDFQRWPSIDEGPGVALPVHRRAARLPEPARAVLREGAATPPSRSDFAVFHRLAGLHHPVLAEIFHSAADPGLHHVSNCRASARSFSRGALDPTEFSLRHAPSLFGAHAPLRFTPVRHQISGHVAMTSALYTAELPSSSVHALRHSLQSAPSRANAHYVRTSRGSARAVAVQDQPFRAGNLPLLPWVVLSEPTFVAPTGRAPRGAPPFGGKTSGASRPQGWRESTSKNVLGTRLALANYPRCSPRSTPLGSTPATTKSQSREVEIEISRLAGKPKLRKGLRKECETSVRKLKF